MAFTHLMCQFQSPSQRCHEKNILLHEIQKKKSYGYCKNYIFWFSCFLSFRAVSCRTHHHPHPVQENLSFDAVRGQKQNTLNGTTGVSPYTVDFSLRRENIPFLKYQIMLHFRQSVDKIQVRICQNHLKVQFYNFRILFLMHCTCFQTHPLVWFF